MASRNTVFIYQSEDLTQEQYEILQETYLSEYEADKLIIKGETEGVLLVNEEDNSLMCMEYVII